MQSGVVAALLWLFFMHSNVQAQLSSIELFEQSLSNESVIRASGTLSLHEREGVINRDAVEALLHALREQPQALPSILLPEIASNSVAGMDEYELQLREFDVDRGWTLSGNRTSSGFSSLVMHVSTNGVLRITTRNGIGSMTVLRKSSSTYALRSTLGRATARQGDYRAIVTESNERLNEADSVVPSGELNSQSDPANRVDLLVVTTAAAATAAGNVSLLNEAVAAAVDDMNIGLANSSVNLRIELVGLQQVSYSETSNITTDLERLREIDDGYIDGVHALRDRYGADLVMMVSNTQDAQEFCGYSGWGSNGERLLAEYGFSIVSEFCVGTMIFAHEIGHNFGLQHDRFVNNSGGYRAYAHGFTAPSRSWRTIMSYPDACNSECVALNRWSNPLQQFSGEALGIPASQINSADNALVLNEVRSEVANFRQQAQPAVRQINLVSSCLAGNGRVDLNVVNDGGSPALYRFELQGQSARQITVGAKDWGRIRISGRPPGSYSVLVERNGVEVLASTLNINCSATVPNVSRPEVTVLNACRASNGYVLFQMVNPGASTKPYVIEFDGVRNRSTSAAGYGQSIRATTGRPDGAYGYRVRTGSSTISSGQVNVSCD